MSNNAAFPHSAIRPCAKLSVRERSFRLSRPANIALCFGNYAKAILMRISLSNRSRVLEFGCGPGTNILKLEASNPEMVVFVDKDFKCIKRASQRYRERPADTTLSNVKFFCLDFLQYSSAEMVCRHSRVANPFDCVLAFYSLQYIAESQEKSMIFFRNCFSILEPGGVILGIMPNAHRLLMATQHPGSLFAIEGLQQFTDKTLTSGVPYTFQISGEEAYHEYTLLLSDMVQAMDGLFEVKQITSVLDFLLEKEIEFPELCASLFSCIVCNRFIGPGSQWKFSRDEMCLVDLYDIVVLSKIRSV